MDTGFWDDVGVEAVAEVNWVDVVTSGGVSILVDRSDYRRVVRAFSNASSFIRDEISRLIDSDLIRGDRTIPNRCT